MYSFSVPSIILQGLASPPRVEQDKEGVPTNHSADICFVLLAYLY
jgi:hypothetical protein